MTARRLTAVAVLLAAPTACGDHGEAVTVQPDGSDAPVAVIELDGATPDCGELAVGAAVPAAVAGCRRRDGAIVSGIAVACGPDRVLVALDDDGPPRYGLTGGVFVPAASSPAETDPEFLVAAASC